MVIATPPYWQLVMLAALMIILMMAIGVLVIGIILPKSLEDNERAVADVLTRIGNRIWCIPAGAILVPLVVAWMGDGEVITALFSAVAGALSIFDKRWLIGRSDSNVLRQP